MNKEQFSTVLEAQQKVISMIASGNPLPECLESICLLIEAMLGDLKAVSSILLLEGSQLRHGAAPSLPKHYCEQVDGLEIGPCVGSCGTALYTQKRVIVSDIGTDPLWHDYKALALKYGLNACWSSPIMSSSGDVLGSFAIYYLKPREPDAYHLELIEHFSHLASLAIEKTHALEREEELNQELTRSHDKFTSFINVLPDLALIVSENGTFCDVYGGDDVQQYTQRKHIKGHNIHSIFPEQSAALMMATIRRALKSGKVEKFEYELRSAKGIRTFEGRLSAFDNYLQSSPEQRYVLWIARDITDRKLAEHQVEQLVFYDPLTNLPNRRLLLERLQLLISKAQRDHQYGALLFLDLDDFKRINDSLGHSVGDQILVLVAERVKPLLRECDVFARIGGDEFVVILEGLEQNVDVICHRASVVAKKIIHAFGSSFELGDSEYRLGISIGISVIHETNITADEALKRADTAMYCSKAHGGSHFTFFDPSLQKILDEQLQIEKAIIESVKQKHFTAYFQPQIGLDGELVGAEALIRWAHPEQGMIAPLEFLPIAEKLGLMHQLQDLVLHCVCEALRELKQQRQVADDFAIAINISASQFKGADLKQNLLNIIHGYGITPKEIKLEITESMLIDNVEFTVAQMNELRQEGFRFAIDDFGTGYSSLTYLQTFPIDELKIDKSFVDNIHKADIGMGIIDAIIALSHHLNFKVIVEGVEEEAQVRAFKEREVKAMQGYYFSKPLPQNQFIEWLEKRS